MQNYDWVELFRVIPADQHNTLVLTTSSGQDLNIECVLRTEGSFLVIRGRVSGITDEGRVFFIPFAQINFLKINRQVKEYEIRQMFGEAVELPPEEAKSPLSGSFPGLLLKPGSRADSSPTNGSRPSSLPAVPAAAAPAPSPVQGITARLSMAPGRLNNGASSVLNPPSSASMMVNVPAAALVAPVTNDNSEPPGPARNSILERLRAQRNSILPPRAPGR